MENIPGHLWSMSIMHENAGTKGVAHCCGCGVSSPVLLVCCFNWSPEWTGAFEEWMLALGEMADLVAVRWGRFSFCRMIPLVCTAGRWTCWKTMEADVYPSEVWVCSETARSVCRGLWDMKPGGICSLGVRDTVKYSWYLWYWIRKKVLSDSLLQ